MELRLLKYFLAVAREGSVTGAAERLHITQPTLSRQIRELEEELGQTLLVRGSRSVSLTGEGLLLQRRAEEILDLVDKTEREVSQADKNLSGDIYLGAGETVGVQLLTGAAERLHAPGVCFHLYSGDSMEICDRLEKGLIDFGLVFAPVDLTRYQAVSLPHRDTWGLLVRQDHPLAGQERVELEQLLGQPLILSRQALKNGLLSDWFGQKAARVQVAGTYTLVFNGSLMVRSGMGCAVCLDKILNTAGTDLRFLPLDPPCQAESYLVWKRHQRFSPAADRYREALLEELAQPQN